MTGSSWIREYVSWGIRVGIVAGKDEACVDKALKLIKVNYEVLNQSGFS